MDNTEEKELEPQGGAVEQSIASSPPEEQMTSSEKDDEMKSDSEENATRGNSESNPSSPQEEITDQPNQNNPKPDDPHSPIVSFQRTDQRSADS